MATKLSRKSLADQVADALVDLIIQRGLGEGAAMPSTAELAEEFEVSRTVVREALADLAGRGILQRSQGRECIVTTPGAGEIHDLLSFRIRRDNVDPLTIQEFREAIEVTAARLAAERRTDEHLVTMRQQLDALSAARTDRAFHDADVSFHRAVAEGSRNDLLLLTLDSLAPLVREHRIRATAARRAQGLSLEPVIEAHENVLRKIEARDREGAARAMSDHLQQSRQALEAAPTKRRTSGGSSGSSGSSG